MKMARAFTYLAIGPGIKRWSSGYRAYGSGMVRKIYLIGARMASGNSYGK